jgi:hypothetical protein
MYTDRFINFKWRELLSNEKTLKTHYNIYLCTLVNPLTLNGENPYPMKNHLKRTI